MKNKEEPSVNSRRGNTCEQADLNRSDCVGPQTTGSLSRPGRTVAARTEQPALSDFSELLRGYSASKLSGRHLPTFVEPPDADPHVRWCGEGHQRTPPTIVQTLGEHLLG